MALRRVDLDRAGDGDILDFVAARRPAAAEHVRRGRRRRGGAAGPPRPGPGPAPTGSSSRSRPTRAPCCPIRSRRCGRPSVLVRRRVHGAAVLLGRPGAVQAAGGGRLRHGDAARGVDRVQPGAADAGRARDRSSSRPRVPVVVDAGLGVPSARGRGDGGGRRRGAGEHGDRGRPGPGRRWRARSRWRRSRAGSGSCAGRRRRRATSPSASSPLTGLPGGPRRPVGLSPARAPKGTARAPTSTPSTSPGCRHARTFTDADVDRPRWPGDDRDLADLAALLSPSAHAAAGGDRRRRPGRPRCGASGGRSGCSPRCTCRTSACRRCTYCGFAKDLPHRPADADRRRGRERGDAADRTGLPAPAAGGRRARRVEVSKDYLVEVRRATARRASRRCRSRRRPGTTTRTRGWSTPACEGVVHYQETYDRQRYAETHIAGWKRNYDWRLNSTELAAAAGVRRLGVGALLGPRRRLARRRARRRRPRRASWSRTGGGAR